MIQFLIKRPIAVLVTTLTLAVLGVVSAYYTPLSILPDFSIPNLTISINASDYNCYQLENEILGPLRENLLNLPNLEDIESYSQHGKGLINLKYRWGTDIKYSYIRLNERIDQLSGLLPKELPRPIVQQKSVSDLPILEMAFTDSMNSSFELNDFLKNVVKRRFEQIDGISKAEIIGGAEEEIRISLDLKLVNELGLEIDYLANIIRGGTYQLGSIQFKDGPYQYHLDIKAQYETIEELKELPINIGNKRIVPLKKIAKINKVETNRPYFVLKNGQSAILIKLFKQQNANLLDVSERVRKTLHQLESDYSNLGMEVIKDSSHFIKFSLDNIRQSLIFGAFFSSILLFLFLSNWRASVVMLTIIPVSLLMTTLCFYLMGLSFNLLTLSGIAIGIGILIDNGIIVVENIDRSRNSEMPLIDLIATRTYQIILPLISSALTTIAIFLPLSLSGELVGSFFKEQVLALIFALVSSLLVAIFFLPVLYKIFFKEEAEKSEKRWLKILKEWYHRCLNIYLGKQRLYNIGIGLLCLLLVLRILSIDIELFPSYRSEYQEIHIEWPVDYKLEENKDRTIFLSELLLEIPGIKNCVAYGGIIDLDEALTPPSLNQVTIGFSIEENYKIEKLITTVGHLMQNYASEASWRIENQANILSSIISQNDYDLEVFFSGNGGNSQLNSKELSLIKEWLLKNEKITYHFPYNELEPSLKLSINQSALVKNQVGMEELIQAIEINFGRKIIGQLNSYDEKKTIVLTNLDFEQKQLDQIKIGEDQKPFNVFFDLDTIFRYKILYADKTGVKQPVYLNMSPEIISPFLQELKEFGLQSNLSIQVDEQYEKDQQLVWQIVLLLCISSSLLYIILAAQFESLLLPFVIIFTLPFGWLGAISLLYVTGNSFNILSGIGIIIISGIVVNDSILKVDTAKKIQKDTLSSKKAILQAGVLRFRPILLTSLTTILAVAPVLFMQGLGRVIQGSLVIAIIGGIVFGTLASLFIIPSLYTKFSKDK